MGYCGVRSGWGGVLWGEVGVGYCGVRWGWGEVGVGWGTVG